MLTIEYTPIEELKFANEQISLEFLSTKPVVDFLKEILPTISNALSGVVSMVDMSKYDEFNKDQTKFLKLISHTPFAEMSEIGAYKPEGMNVTYLEFLEEILPYTKMISTIQTDVLNPYSSFLAQLVSDTNYSLSTDSKELEYKKMEDTRDNIYKKMGAMYSKNSYEVSTIVKKVIDRNADWTTVFSMINECDKNIQLVDRELLKKTIKLCVDYLNVIIDKLEKTGAAGGTPQVAKRLSNGAYQVAKQCELFSYIYYRVLSINGAVKNTIDKIQEVYN